MNHLSLFSGVGGFDLAFELAGMTSIGQVELDEKAREVLERRWPQVKKWSDVQEVHSAGQCWTDEGGTDGLGARCKQCLPESDRVDVLSGGFPCTDLSVAGRRRGLDGDASGLWFEFARLILEVAPTWVVIENVPGLLSSNEGRDLGTILGFLGDHGFRFAYRVLDSQWFGVPQRRRRLFIVASRRGGSPTRVLFEPSSGRGDHPPGSEAGSIAAGTLARSVGRVGGGDDIGANKGTLIAFAQNSRSEVRETGGNLVGALPAEQGSQQQTYLAFPSGGGDRIAAEMTEDVTPPVTAQLSPLAVFATTGAGWWREGAPTVAAHAANGDRDVVVAFDPYNMAEAANTHTLRAATGDGVPQVRSSGGVRRLMPVEYERLQGFPDGWVSSLLPRTHSYRMMGNAVTVPVVSWIGSRIVAEANR